MILDSSFLIDLLRNPEGPAKERSEELDRTFCVKGISSVSVMELWRGVLRCSNSDVEIKKINELISSLNVYPLGTKEAKKAAEIEADLIKRGEMIDLEDIMIAGTAKVHNEKVLTRNSKHFLRVKELDVEIY